MSFPPLGMTTALYCTDSLPGYGVVFQTAVHSLSPQYSFPQFITMREIRVTMPPSCTLPCIAAQMATVSLPNQAMPLKLAALNLGAHQSACAQPRNASACKRPVSVKAWTSHGGRKPTQLRKALQIRHNM